MTQAIEARKQRGDNINEPAECGILKEVELHNFMCHHKMIFKLGPMINFICGKNGSGKSAILTAIVLCLGGKASATNRGARLQNFIKEGTDHATIICKVKNRGENAYMPELYGRTIQVERHILRSGTSGFKLKSEKGRVVSTRKSDLEEICDHMMLQIENPMAVLSQDQARQFISSANAAEKYKFFMKGVQLEQLDQDYRLIEEQLDNISAKIGARAPDLKHLKDKQESAARKLALSDQFEVMRERLREQRRQLTWAQVEGKEAIRDSYARELQDAEAKIANAQARADELDALFQEADQLATTAKEDYSAAKANTDRLKDEKKEMKDQQDETKKDYQNAAAEQRQIRELLTSVNKTIEKHRNSIEEERQRLEELDGGGAARRITELEEAKEAVITANREVMEHVEQRKERLHEIERMQKLVDQTKESKEKEDSRVTNLQNHLKTLKENRATQDRAFHPNMANLLQALQREKGFQERPIGPLGKHVQLLKPEWSQILEKVFGGSLNGFIVTSKRDEHLLSNVMRRNQCSVPVFIANKLPMDIEANQPDDRFQTILRALEIDNEMVKKQLIIAHAIEQCILIPDMEDASKTMFGEAPLRKVKRCYCFAPADKTKGFMLSYRHNGSAAQDPVAPWSGPPRMKTDAEQNIRRQEEALADCKTQRLHADEELRSANGRLVKANQALKRHESQTRDLRIAVQRAQENVETLEDAIKNDSIESGKLEQFRKALQTAEEQKVVHENSYQDSVTEVDDKTRILREATDKCNAMDDQIAEAGALADKAQALAQKADKKRAHDLGEKNNAFAIIEDARADHGSMERRLQGVEEEVVSFTEQARQVCERVNLPEGETYDSLKKKHDKLRVEHQKYQAQVGDRDQIAAEATRWSNAFNTAKEEMKALESLQAQLTRTLTDRRHRWEQFKMYITCRARADFIIKLSERGFRGKLQIDHKKRAMDIAVEPDITKRDGAGRSAKTLSGGEKSFSQICLLLSIWDAMGVPIRCLDEFDVFMDAVNRNTSVKLLVDGARHSSGGQFILISPGTRADIVRAPDVNIVE